MIQDDRSSEDCCAPAGGRHGPGEQRRRPCASGLRRLLQPYALRLFLTKLQPSSARVCHELQHPGLSARHRYCPAQTGLLGRCAKPLVLMKWILLCLPNMAVHSLTARVCCWGSYSTSFFGGLAALPRDVSSPRYSIMGPDCQFLTRIRLLCCCSSQAFAVAGVFWVVSATLRSTLWACRSLHV